MFHLSLAGYPFTVDNRYEYVKTLCRDYWTQTPGEYVKTLCRDYWTQTPGEFITVGKEDIAREQTDGGP